MTRTAQSPAGGRKEGTSRRGRVSRLAMVLMAVAGLVAACSDGGSHAAASSSRNATSTQSSARQSGILFVNCMRSHGITDISDPVPGGGFDIPKGVKSEPRFQSASQACQKDLPGGGSAAKTKHVNIQQELNFARCMRSHGITDFPDPLPSGGWDLPGDTNSPQFEAAAHACQSTGVHWNAAP